MLNLFNTNYYIFLALICILLCQSQSLVAQLSEPISCDDSGVPEFNVRACNQGFFVGSDISTRDNNLNLLADVSLIDIGGANSVVVMDGTEFCDENGDTEFSSEGPDVFFNIPVQEGKRESCEAAVLTITLRGDFNNGCEVAYIVNECGIIIQQSEITGLPENDKCDVIFPLEIRIPAADITEMAADGVISFSIRTNGGTNGLQGSEVDGTCNPGRGVDCDGDGVLDGNCFAVESFIWPIRDNSFAGTLNSTENIICPGESLNIDVLQNLTFSDPLGLGDGDDQTGTYHLDFYFGGGPNPANPYDTNFGGVGGDVINAYDVPGLGSNPSVTIINNGGTGIQDHTNTNAPLATGGGNLPSNTLIEVLGSVWVDGDLEPSAAGFCTGEIIGCGFTTDYISFVLLDPITAVASCTCTSGNNAVVTISGFNGGLPAAVAAGATPGGIEDYTLQPTGGVLSSTFAGIGGSVTLTLDPGETNWSVTIVDADGCEFHLSGSCGIEEEAEIFLPAILCLVDEDIDVALSPLGGSLVGPGVTGTNFNPATAGVGTHTLTYTFEEDDCEITTEIDVTVQSGADLDASFDKSSDSVCPDDIIELTPSEEGGVFMGFGVTDNGDGTGGTFTVSDPGFYAVTYTVSSTGGCSSVFTCVIEVVGSIDAPTVDVAASPTCYTDGSSIIQFFNADGSLINLTNSFFDGDFTDSEITIIKVPSPQTDGSNHATVDAAADFGLTSATAPFQATPVRDVIRVIPEHLIGESFEYAGIYEVCLFIPEEENEGCEDVTACSQITLYPSMDPCFSLPDQLCEDGDNFTIDVAVENPTFDDLAPDLLGRSQQEMSVWTLIAPDGTVIEEDELGIVGLADGDVTIQTNLLGNSFGPGLYTLNHEMGIDICATFCSRTFELIADQSVSFFNEAIDCVENATGVIDLESLNDGSTDNSLGGTWSLVSGPASANFTGSSFFYSEAGCYRIRYDAPDFEGELINCNGPTADVWVRVSEQPQPSFDIQDQICFSDGDATNHIYDALINSPSYSDGVTRFFSVLSGPGNVINANTGRVQITGVGTVVFQMMETIFYNACNDLPAGSCTEVFSVQIEVEDGTMLNADFDIDDVGCPNEVIDLEPDVNGGVFTGEGVTDNGLGTGGTFTVSDPGVYAVTYTLNSPNGCTNSFTRNIEVLDLADSPLVNIAASPICFTDGSSLIQFFNPDGSLVDLALAAFTDGDFTDPEIVITKVPTSLVDGNNHDTFNASTTFGFSGASSVFQLIQADDLIRVNPEHLIGESFEFGGIYEVCLFLPVEDDVRCEPVMGCNQLTIFPSMDPCFELDGTICESTSDFRIDVSIENPTFDDLAPDLLGRSRNEMSVWQLIAPDGTLIEEDEPGLNGISDGDVILQYDDLFAAHGPGLYTLNHEMGVDICATFCSRTFEIIEEQVLVLEDLKIECEINPTGTVSLESLIDPANSTNILGGTWALTGGPNTGIVSSSFFSYTEAGCYEFTYTLPSLPESADDCEANAQSAFICISEQPQPSFDIQDQVCFSDGDPASVHQYTPIVNSPSYDNPATSVWTVQSGPATIINSSTGQIQITGEGTVILRLTETLSYGACGTLIAGFCSEFSEVTINVENGTTEDASFTFSGELCPGATISLTPATPGGVFTGEGVVDNGDGTGGVFTPTGSGASSITYTLNTPNGCTNSFTQTITIDDEPPLIICPEDVEVECGSGPPPNDNPTMGSIEYNHNINGGTSIAGINNSNGLISSVEDITFGPGVQLLDNGGNPAMLPNGSTFEHILTNVQTNTAAQAIADDDYAEICFTPSAKTNITSIREGIFFDGTNGSGLGDFQVTAEISSDGFMSATTLYMDAQIPPANPVNGMNFFQYVEPTNFSASAGTRYCIRFYLYNEQNNVTTNAGSPLPDNTVSFDDVLINLEECPVDQTLEAFLTSASATDNCGDVTITTELISTTPGCGNAETQLYQFTATDESGNTSTCFANYSIIDNTPPDLMGPNGNLIVDCSDQNIDATIETWLNTASATDLCGDVSITNDFTSFQSLDICTNDQVSQTVTFTATDECGNVSTSTAMVSLVDNTPPVMAPPANLTLPCSDLETTTTSISSWLASVSAADACDPDVFVTNNFTQFNINICSNDVIAVTWTATDVCGNTTTVMADLIIEGDETPPMFSFTPAPLTIDCNSGDVTLGNWLNSAIAADACDPDITITNDYSPTAIDICSGGGSTTVTWTATDACGNVATTTSTITVTPDNTPPAMAAPADLTLPCSDLETTTSSISSWLASVSATDVCDPDIIVSNNYTAFNVDLCTPSTTTVTWTATDDCGNITTVMADLIIEGDETPPVFSFTPAPLTIDCNSGDVTLGNWLNSAIAADACDPDISITNDYTPTAIDICNGGGSTTITWTTTDACGNVATTTSTITVTPDNTPPVIVPPGPITIDCSVLGNGDPSFLIDSLLANVSASDICDPDVIVSTSFDSGLIDLCAAEPYDITITFNATDACGNDAMSQTTTISIVPDNTPPVAICCADFSTSLVAGMVTIDIDDIDCGSLDNCTSSDDLRRSMFRMVNGVVDRGVNGEFFNLTQDDLGVNEIFLVVEDFCGNADTCSVQVDITSDPSIGLAKRVSRVIPNSDGSNIVQYEFNIENFGDVNLSNIQVTDNLANIFNPCGIVNILSITSDDFTVNAGFNGSTDTQLLVGDDDLPIGDRGSVLFEVLVDNCNGEEGPFDNTAIVSAETPDGNAITDISQNGSDPDPNNDGPENNSEETPVQFEFFSFIGASKSVNNLEVFQDGSAEITYRFTIENFGNLVLDSITLKDNFTGIFDPCTIAEVIPGSLTSSFFEVNEDFDGFSDIELLAMTVDNSLNPGEIGTVFVTVLINDCGDDPDPFLNQAQVVAQDASGTIIRDDFSNVGNDPDPDGDNDPTNNDIRTPVDIGFNPSIGIAKRVVSGPTLRDDGCFDVVYELNVENTGDLAIANIQVTDNLTTTFANADSFYVVGITSEEFDVNVNYDGGVTDAALLTGLDTLNVEFFEGEEGSILLEVVVCSEMDMTFNNQATALGTALNNEPLTDLSTDGSDPDPERDGSDNNSVPTPITLGTNPSLELDKRVSEGPIENADGTFDLTYEIRVENTGDIPLVIDSLLDSLDITFADAAAWDIIRLESEQFDINDNYDGAGDYNLINGPETLNVGDAGAVFLGVRVSPTETATEYLNSATVTGESIFGGSLEGTGLSDGANVPVNLVCQNTIICPAFPDTIIQSNDLGWCLAVVNFPFAEADLCAETTDVQFEYLLDGVGVDGVPNNVWLPGQPSGLSYNVGVTDVTMRYQFSLNGEPGVSDSCKMVIYVVDKEAPLLTASIPTDITIDCCTPLDTFMLSQTQVTDNCAGFGEVMITRDIISNRSDDPADCEYYEYVDTIRWTLSDGMISPNEGVANLSVFAQVVTHIDTMAPTIILPPDLIVTECRPDTTFNVVDFEEIIVDTVTTRIFLDGVWIEVDEIIKETIPVIDTVVNGTTYGQALAFDKCSPDSVIMAELTFMDSIVVECKGEKEATIFRIWSVSDPCGNSTRAIQEISIIDRNPPEIECRDSITVTLNASGQFRLTNDDLLLSIRSACYDDSELAEVTIEPNVFNCNDIGVHRVVVTATDLCGGSSSFCEVFVNVVDTLAPVLNCPATPIIISELPRDCALDLPELRQIMSSADCDVTFITDPPLFADGLPLGVQQVTVTATDASGNSSSCIIDVDVQASLDIPSSMTCISSINLSLDQDCEARITPEMLFLGPDGICPNFLCVDIQDEDGNDHANFFDISDDGQEFVVTLNDCNGSNNSCWGLVRIELKNRPNIVFPSDTTLLCVESTDPDNPRLGFPVATNCVDGWTFDFRDTHINFDRCDIPRARIERVWTITDRQGDIQIDTQFIDILPFNTVHLLFPADITIEEPLECGEVEETLDEIENAVLSETSRIHPDSTGSPNLFGIPLNTNGGLCLFALGYEDRVLEICEGSFQILREWEVSDVCSPFERDVNPISHTQVITVFDTRQPQLVSGPDTIVMSIDPHTCTFNGPLPYVLAEEECSFVTFDAYISGGGFITFDGEFNTPEFDVRGNRIPVGSHRVTNVFKDACGNVAIYDYTLIIQDWIAPTVITEDTVFLSLTSRQGDSNTLSKIGINAIDAGSNDNNCSEIDRCLLLEEEFNNPITRGGVHLQDDAGRFMYSPSQDYSVEVFEFSFFDGSNTVTESISYTYCRPELAFDCDDIGPHGVVLLVSDSAGNVSSGHTTVVVEDKGNVRLICDDVTIDCGEDFSVEAIGLPEIIGSSCQGSTLHNIDIEDFRTCGIGQIEREWYIDSVFACSQIITIEGMGDEAFNPLTIKWPVHADGSTVSGISRSCDNNVIRVSDSEVNMSDELSCDGMISTAPIWCETECSLVESSFVDQSFEASEGCRKILRTWTVIDWCTFQSNEDADNDFETGDDSVIAVDDRALGQGNWDASLQNGDTCATCKNDADNSPSSYFRFTEVDADGLYHFDQIITITDDTAPTIDVESEVVFDIMDGAENKEDPAQCAAIGSVTATATDLCGDNDIDPTDLVWSAEIVDESGNELDEVSGVGNALTIMLPESGLTDEYLITWHVTDRCNNMTRSTTSVSFTDSKSPTPVCLDDISTATITGSGEAVIWAVDLDQGSFDNCSDVEIGFLDSNGVLQPNFIVSCDDLNGAADTTISLDLYVEDASGNRDFCTVNLRIDNNQNNCTGEESGAIATAAGLVYNESEQMIENAQVMLNGSQSVVTDVSGSYAFENIREDRSHFITVSRTDSPLNGITAIDIVLMQRHILGLQVLEGPYKIYASDLNIDERITAIDQVELRRAILGLKDELGEVDSWRFIPKALEPSSREDLYPVQDTLFISGNRFEEVDFNLIGIKMGDVNGDAIPNSSLGQIRQTESLLLETAFDQVSAGEELIIDFTSQKELLALQLTLDISNYEFVALRSGRFNMTSDDYAVHDNSISFIWTEDYIKDGHTYEEWEVLYSLVLRSNIDQSVSESIRINSDITESLAYASLEERLDLNGEHRETAGGDLILYQNTPNPFRGDTQIKFYNPKADQVEVTIYDALGRLVYKSTEQYLRGEHTIMIERDDLQGASGVLTYRIESTNDSQVGHMISIQ